MGTYQEKPVTRIWRYSSSAKVGHPGWRHRKRWHVRFHRNFHSNDSAFVRRAHYWRRKLFHSRCLRRYSWTLRHCSYNHRRGCPWRSASGCHHFPRLLSWKDERRAQFGQIFTGLRNYGRYYIQTFLYFFFIY